MARRQEFWWKPLRGYIARRGLPKGLFLEVACGGRPRSTFLTSVHGLQGFATDISIRALLNARRRMEILGVYRQPVLICADAEALPFREGSVPFMMTFEFLHHLPEIEPFLEEVRRVLGRGTYYFDGEPFAPRFCLHLYRRSRECTSLEERERHPLIRLVRYYVSDPLCHAAEEGVVERMGLRIQDWVDALRPLPEVRLRATTLGNVWTVEPLVPRRISSFLFDLIGGNLEGYWDDGHPTDTVALGDPLEAIACPSCYAPLTFLADSWRCGSCTEAYPTVEGIPILIPSTLRRRLYPSLG